MEEFMYYTLQGDYTLEALKKDGYYYSTRENNYWLIDLVKHHFNSKGIVYYFKVKKNYEGSLPTSGRGEHLIKFNGDTLSKNRIEFVASKFNKAMLMCDALCCNKFIDAENRFYSIGKPKSPIEVVVAWLKREFDVDFDFFRSFGAGESDVYVGLTDIIHDRDVIKVIKNYPRD